ncbi:hypothetical protein O9993_18930 [Vibrio lentus]|nr:hypothetical protein [Vibrio lentus]
MVTTTLEDDLIVEPGALFKEDISEGTYLTQVVTISNPGDRDYMLLSLTTVNYLIFMK